MPHYVLNILVTGDDQASGPLGNVGTSLNKLGTAGLAAAAGGIAAVTAGLASSITTAADFETTMSGVAAALSPTADEFAALSQKALQLGADTAYSASAAASAIDMLARNGLNATQILDGAADATVALAAATGADLSTAANIATDAMAIFGIAAADMSTAVNGISGVTVASKFGIEDYALALAQGGGVASAAGVNFQDFNTTIAAISPLFASGSDAGTSFKVMLQNLIPKSKDAAGLMRELGIITTDYAAIAADLGVTLDDSGQSMYALQLAIDETVAAQSGAARGTKAWDDAMSAFLADFEVNAFFDANGQMKDMAAIAGILQQAFGGLSDKQKNNALSTIFGTDAMRAAVALANTGTDGFLALAQSIGQVDAATQAATRLDNFNGALEQMKGSLETLQIVIGQAFLPILSDLLNTYVTPGVNQVTAFAQAVMASGDPFGMLVGAINGVLPGFAGFVSWLVQAWAQAQPLISVIQANLVPILGSLAAVAGGAVVVAIGSAVAAFASTAAPIAAMVAAGAALLTAWQRDFLGVQTVVTAVLSALWEVIAAVVGQITAFWQAHGSEILTFATTTWQSIQAIIATTLQIIQATVVPLLQGIAAFIASHGQEIQNLFSAAWHMIQSVISTVLGVIQGLLTTFLAVVQGDWDGAWQGILQVTESVLSGLQGVITGALDTIKEGIHLAIDGIVAIAESLGADISSGIVDGILSGIDAVIDAAVDVAESALDAAMDALGIHSPSKVFEEEVGLNAALGLATGLSGGQGLVSDAGAQLAQASVQGAQSTTIYFQPQYVAGQRTAHDDLRLMQMLMGGA